jgi:uncharacterized protein (UPF0264 family)
MIDTAIKDDKHIFEFLNQSEIKEFIQNCHERRIHTALAGSLSGPAFETAVRLRPDVIGVRKAALRGHDRILSRVDSEAVERLKGIITMLR